MKGGIENSLRALAEGQAASGHDVTVLVTSPNGRTSRSTIGGVRVAKAGRNLRVASTPISLRLWVELAGLDADVYHLHFPYPWGELGCLLTNKSRLVVTYHSDIVRQKMLGFLYRPFALRLLNRADAVLATSPQYLESSALLAKFRSKTSVVTLGVDTAKFDFAPAAEVARVREECGTPLVLFVGVLRYYKGLQYLVEAMQEVRGHLLIVGAGPLREALLARIRSAGLQKRITLLDAVEDALLPAIYKAADVYVLPACERSEALGLSLMEAMAAGTPVISTELGTGTSYVNQDGVTGIVVPARDPRALAVAINRITQNQLMRRSMGEAAKTRCQQLFTVERMVVETLASYSAVLDKRAAARKG